MEFHSTPSIIPSPITTPLSSPVSEGEGADVDGSGGRTNNKEDEKSNDGMMSHSEDNGGVKDGEATTTAEGGRGVIQTIKNMFKSSSTPQQQQSNDGKENVMDPYIRGPEPFFTAKLINDAPLTSTGSNMERLNLALHFHDNGIARVRITEDYFDPSTASSTSSSNAGKAYSNARWTSDELILNVEEMKEATVVTTYDHTTVDGKNMLQKLLLGKKTERSTMHDDHDEKESNYVAFKFGQNKNIDVTASSQAQENDESTKCTNVASLVLLQFQPFELHLFRDDGCNSSSSNSYGQPIVSINTENLLHFEIRRWKENNEKQQQQQQQQQAKTKKHQNDQEISTDADTAAAAVPDQPDPDSSEEEVVDRHGGKEIVGYWEDGLAIYADGTREERKEEVTETIVAEERRRHLSEEDDSQFHFDTEGMWEEKFGPHTDSKPYGPMSVGADITFPESKHLFGLPEHASSTQLQGTTGDGARYKEPYRLYNLDVFEYELDETMALYGEVPLIVSQSKHTGTVGVFWFNPTETFVDVENISSSGTDGTRTHWMSESGIIDLFLLPGPNPKSLYEQYATLTGRMPLPPMWSLGYHQCRWNYRDEADVYAVHSKFEELDYPYDVLWLDIEHTDGKRYFTWDENLFPNPMPMQVKLKSQGRNMVTIIDPHIKRDQNYYIHKEATAKGLYIKDSDGTKDFDGWCWPGSSSYLDFTNAEVRNWWAEQFGYDKYIGSTSSLFTWNDMNEPSVFNGPEVSLRQP